MGNIKIFFRQEKVANITILSNSAKCESLVMILYVGRGKPFDVQITLQLRFSPVQP